MIYSNCRPENHSKKELGEEGYRNAIAKMLQDEDIKAFPEIVGVLRNPEAGINPFIVDLILHPLYDNFWKERTVNYDKINRLQL